MRVLAITAAAAILGVGCTDYGCADVDYNGMQAGEWCGPLGSFGYDHYNEGIVHVFFSAETQTNTPEYTDLTEYLPAFGLMFKREHLADGTVLGLEHLTGYCSRLVKLDDDDPFDMGTYTTQLPPDTTDLTIAQSNRSNSGAPAWDLTWDVGCTGLDMHSQGSDVVEITPTDDPFDSDFYGTPPDWGDL